jgi:hypothetical protein
MSSPRTWRWSAQSAMVGSPVVMKARVCHPLGSSHMDWTFRISPWTRGLKSGKTLFIAAIT